MNQSLKHLECRNDLWLVAIIVYSDRQNQRRKKWVTQATDINSYKSQRKKESLSFVTTFR